jgi:hypothetical protein
MGQNFLCVLWMFLPESQATLQSLAIESVFLFLRGRFRKPLVKLTVCLCLDTFCLRRRSGFTLSVLAALG